MVKEIIARGQATITLQQDAYTITQSVSNYIFSTATNGTITNAVSFTSTLRVSSGNNNIDNFTIGSISKPAGFSAITVNNTNKTIDYSVTRGTTNLADNGHIIIPVIIEGVTYPISFNWSKSKTGQSGTNGVDGYTIKSSRQGYAIPTDKDGRIHTAVNTSTIISALKGKTPVTPVIGTLPSVAGCTLSKSGTTVTIIFTAGTSLAESGVIDIPVMVDGFAFQVSVAYAKAKTGANGATGAAGVDANMLDWVRDWNSNKTTIGTGSVITPKLFAGVKNSNGTLTGTAIGRYALSTLDDSGSIVTRIIDGIYGFKDGYKTFALDNTGSVMLGKGNQFIRYNSATGQVEFGSDVCLNWIAPINTAKADAILSAAATAQAKADAARNAAISSAATDAANKVNAIRIGGRNYIRNSSFTANLTGISAEGTTVSIDTSTLYNNYPTLKVIQDTACTDANAASQRTYFNAINGKVCTPASFSMYVKGTVASAMKIRIGGTGIRTFNITTSWQRVVLEDITPTSAVVLFGFQTAGTYWCALPMLVQGTKMADWYPAPEDVDYSVLDAKKTGTDARAVADAITGKANSEGWSNKLTYIGATGIFTGTLSANTVNAIRINATQITAGTINVERIDVAALKASLITAGNIEALTLNVVRGKIGGWNINSTQIYKNNICLSADGSIYNTGKWRLNNDGSGQVASGNITWNAAGTVTFSSAVRLNWTDDIDKIQIGGNNLLNNSGNWRNAAWNGGYTTNGGGYTIDTAIKFNGKPTLRTNAGTGVVHSAWIKLENNVEYTYSAMVRCDRAVTGHGTMPLHCWAGKDNTCQSKVAIIKYDTSVVAHTWKRIYIVFKLTADADSFRPYLYRGSAEGVFNIAYFKLEKGNRPTDWNQSDADTNKLSTDAQQSANSVTAALGGSNFPKLTQITSTGIYTGTLTAAQVNAVAINAASISTGTLNADRIAAGSITSTKLDANSIKANIINVTYINGLTCTFVRGTIGGWTIASTQISKNNIVLGADGNISNSTKWRLNNDGSGQIASGNISWNTAGEVTFGGAVSLQWKNDIQAAKSTNYGYRYMKTIIINGESNKYYPVVIKGGDQSIKRNILVRRSYSEQAPSDWANSTTHIGGLILHIKTNFGGWGGSDYSWDIYELSEVYCRMFAGAAFCGNYCMFAVYLRGGGTTGAKYHIYSDQPLENDTYSPSPIPPSPQIALYGDLIFKSPKGNGEYYLAYAPAPRTLTTAVQNEVRRHKFIALAQSSDTTLTEHPLTYISGTGIYTGTLTANQVNAVAINASSITTGILSADRIAAGSIHSTKLNADSIKGNIVNASYINGLTCTFVRGTIGGWTITGSTLSAGQLLLDKGNKRVVVYGASSGPANGHRVQMYHNSNTDFGIYATDTAGTNLFRLGSANSIAGWTITASQISKNNISLGADGSINNGVKWRLGNDGAGRLANGNIIWDASGKVTFGPSVSLNWTNAANNALNTAKSYADTKKGEAISTAATDATNKANAAKELASAMAFGKMLYRDPEFRNGNNSINVYNNNGNGTVAITRTGLSSAPNDSKTVLEIRTTGSASPDNGGFYFGTTCSNRKVFITRIIAKIPAGRNIDFATNSIGTNGSRKWLTPTTGTGDWQEYIYKVVCGTSNFSSTHFFYITGTQGTTAAPLVWHMAYATVFDTTSSEKYTTTIDSNGIYTGTIRASQVLVDSTLVVGGSSYNGSVSVQDAGNNVKVTLNRSGINAVAGQIGGWNIDSTNLYAGTPNGGHRVGIRSNGYIFNDNGSINFWALKPDGSAEFGSGKITFNRDGSGFVANRNITWDSSGNVTMRGTITAGAGNIAGFTIRGNKLVNTASDSSIEFTSLMGNASLIINSSSALLSLRADSARTGIYLQTYAAGARGIYIVANAGSKYSIEAYGPMQLGQRAGERWCVPGVLYIGCKYNTGNSTNFSKIWGEGCNVTSCSHLGSSQYRFYHNLGHTNYTVIAQVSQSYGHYGSFRLLERSSSYFTIQNLGSSGKPDAAPFDFIIYGRNKW